MKISSAFAAAKNQYKQHFPSVAAFLVIELCMVLTTFCFALFLTGQGFMPWLSLLCVPAFLLLLVPARQNAADAMQDALGGGVLNSFRLVSTENYGKKFSRGLLRVLILLLWAAPLIALFVIARVSMAGSTDGFTVMRAIMNFGGGKLVNGMVRLLLILLAALLIFLFGLGLNSGARHLQALGNNRLLCKKPWKNLLCWLLASLVTMIPLFIAIGVNVVRYLPVLKDLAAVMTGKQDLPSTRLTLIIIGVGALLTMPLLPMRSLITAAFVRGVEEELR